MSLRLIKRHQMLFDFRKTKLPSLELPDGFWYVPWEPSLLAVHADIKHRGFRNETDAILFPTFKEYPRCLSLMQAISSSQAFIPEATLLIAYGESSQLFEYVANIQGMKLSGDTGGIQNVAVLPEYRRQGLGRALVLGSLWGFRRAGIQKVSLEVTADNFPATRLYEQIGFRTFHVNYREVMQ